MSIRSNSHIFDILSTMDEIEKLKAENEELKKIIDVKSDLISISAHQLRTSLSAIKWTLRMFMDKDLGEMTPEQEEFIDKAFNRNQDMIKLVNNLLLINKADDTAVPFNFKEVDLTDLIDKTLLEFTDEAKKKYIEIVFQKSENESALASCDDQMIHIVFQNLIENSIKYSHEHGKVFINIKHDTDKKNIEISVQDSGIGIDAKDHKNIFNKLFRANNAMEKDHDGSGLGLFTTKNIVERHKGKIWFESKEKEGTTFHVSLPIS